MSTFEELVDDVTIITRDFAIDTIAFLRKAENDFIKRTLCTEKYLEAQTASTNPELYSLPNDFVKEYRIEFNGARIKKYFKGSPEDIFMSDNNLVSGVSGRYVIENQKIRFIPQPSSNTKFVLWYCYKNTDSSSASPIIPEIEHEYLPLYAIAKILMIHNDERWQIFWADYLENCEGVKTKYFNQRFTQDIIYDDTGGEQGSMDTVHQMVFVLDEKIYTEADASEYSGGKLSPSNQFATIAITSQGLTNPDYELTPTCDKQLWVESATSQMIKIGIGDGSEQDNVTFRLRVFEKST